MLDCESLLFPTNGEAHETWVATEIDRLRRNCRKLGEHQHKLGPAEGNTQEYSLLAREELQFFRLHLSSDLHRVERWLATEDARASLLRGEVAWHLAEIAIHYSWAGESAAAEALLEEALQLAAGTEAISAIQQNYTTQCQQQPPPRSSQPLSSLPPRSSGWRQQADIERFPERLPLLDSDGWRVCAALLVLIITIAACLAGSDGSSVAAGGTGAHPLLAPIPAASRTPAGLPAPMLSQQFGKAERAPAVVMVADPVSLKVQLLLAQIQAEERTVRQIERQLAPLRQQVEAMRSAPVTQALRAHATPQEGTRATHARPPGSLHLSPSADLPGTAEDR